jgi:hypothetical protein
MAADWRVVQPGTAESEPAEPVFVLPVFVLPAFVLPAFVLLVAVWRFDSAAALPPLN